MAVTNPNEVLKLAHKLATTAKFKIEAATSANRSVKFLLVEGKTDKDFMDHVKATNVDCLIADHIFNERESGLRTRPLERINCKDAIVQLIVGLSRFPSSFITYPSNIDKLEIYGLVDSDCDELRAGAATPRLFITHTHDLETMLLSTDKSIFDRIENCNIPTQDIGQAYFIAFQLAYARESLDEYYDKDSFDLGKISCGSNQVDFLSFVQNSKINIIQIAKYVSENSPQPHPTQKFNQMCEKILKDKAVRKKFGNDGNWKQELENFNHETTPDFWLKVNGHDILQILQYYNESVYAAFHVDCVGLNRMFEGKLISIYDYSCFIGTPLHTKMKEQEVVC